MRRATRSFCAGGPDFLYKSLLMSQSQSLGKQHMRSHFFVGSIRPFSFAVGILVGLSASASAMAATALSHGPDPLFHDGMEGITAGPFNDSDASRFLAQATFGPTDTDIAT